MDNWGTRTAYCNSPIIFSACSNIHSHMNYCRRMPYKFTTYTQTFEKGLETLTPAFARTLLQESGMNKSVFVIRQAAALIVQKFYTTAMKDDWMCPPLGMFVLKYIEEAFLERALASPLGQQARCIIIRVIATILILRLSRSRMVVEGQPTSCSR
eukprot:3456814-Amphidinium_carterae.1